MSALVIRQLLLFGIIGIVTLLVNQQLYLTLISFGSTYTVAISFSYFLTAALHFFLNRCLTFRNVSDSKLEKQFANYILLLFVNFLITYSTGIVIRYGYQGCDCIVIPVATFLCAINSFFLMKFFVFKKI